nr:unnamed protein product [Callosobruchus analis]
MGFELMQKGPYGRIYFNGAFLIPYLMMLFFCGIPLFFMESSLGQFSSTGCITVFKICPLFKDPLPWSSCDNHWNTKDCIKVLEFLLLQWLGEDLCITLNVGGARTQVNDSIYRNLNRTTVKTPADEFFHIEEMGSIDGFLLLCNILSWIIVYLCIMKGIQSVGKVVYFTAVFPFVILFILLIRGLTLPGSWDGVYFYIWPEWDQLGNLKVWADAALQLFFSLGPGWGGIVNISSYNDFRNNCKIDAIIVPIVNIGTSILAGFVVFSVIGFMAHETGMPISTVATGGPGLAFITYPAAISLMPWPNLWAFVTIETVVSAIVDDFPYLRKFQFYVTLVTVVLSASFSIIYCTSSGMYWLQLFDWYAASISVVVICLSEVVIVGWTYGIKKFIRDVEFMTGERLLGYPSWLGIMLHIHCMYPSIYGLQITICRKGQFNAGLGAPLKALKMEGNGPVSRGKWKNKTEAILSCIGYAVGIGNIWRFPYLLKENSVRSSSNDSRSRNESQIAISSGIEYTESIDIYVLLCNIVSWIIVYLCIMKGTKSIGRVIYFTALFPILVLFCLLIRGLTLPGAWDGVYFYIWPQWDQLGNLKVWADAALQIFFSLGPGWGGIVNISSFNSFRNNCKLDSIVVPIVNCCTAILAGFVVFSVIGFMAHRTGMPVSTVATGGPSLAFITYPAAISLMPWPNLWAILFFLMMYNIGIDTLFVCLETIATGIVDDFPQLRKFQFYATLFTVVVAACFSLIYCTNKFQPLIQFRSQSGIYWLQLFDWYSSSIPLVIICLSEAIMVGWIYGVKRFIRDVQFMTGEKLSYYWILSWKVITPLYLVRLTRSLKPSPDWGPANPHDRSEWKYKALKSYLKENVTTTQDASAQQFVSLCNNEDNK